jgi:hypothetical protein
MDLIARRVIFELEGEEGSKYIDEYISASTERGKKLRTAICEKDPTQDAHLTNKKYVDNQIGNIETALDNIIAIQNELIGGGTV